MEEEKQNHEVCTLGNCFAQVPFITRSFGRSKRRWCTGMCSVGQGRWCLLPGHDCEKAGRSYERSPRDTRGTPGQLQAECPSSCFRILPRSCAPRRRRCSRPIYSLVSATIPLRALLAASRTSSCSSSSSAFRGASRSISLVFAQPPSEPRCPSKHTPVGDRAPSSLDRTRASSRRLPAANSLRCSGGNGEDFLVSVCTLRGTKQLQD